MSTNSCIAIPDGDGFRGKYAHSDGYPQHMGKTLHAIVNSKGLAEAQRVLVHESAGFSSVDDNADRGLWSFQQDDPRFILEPGFGVRYDPVLDGGSVDEWITPFAEGERERDNWGTQWGYVLSEGGLVIWLMGYGGSLPTYVTLIPWDATDTDWEAVEAAAYADA